MNIYEKIFVHYGADHLYSNFKEAYASPKWSKPLGGLWGTEVTDERGSIWGDWCRSERFHIRSLAHCFHFKVNPSAKILCVDSVKDIKPFIRNGEYGWTLDVQKIIDTFDGIYVSWEGREEVDATAFDQFGQYDVPSICLFRADSVVELDDSDIEKLRYKDYSVPQRGDSRQTDKELEYLKQEKIWQMYGNRNRFSDDRIFGNELPAMAAQGEGPNAEMARKYNGTIISALREGKRIYITEGQFKKIVGHMLSECLPKANRFDN